MPLVLDREIPPVKVFFNVAQFSLGTCVALTVFGVLAVSRDALDPGVWSATLLAVFATALVADVTIGAAIQLAEGGVKLRTRTEMLAINWGVATVNGSLPLAAASRSPQIVPELEVLLDRTCDAFRVDFAELLLFSAEFGPSLRSTRGPGDRKQMLESLDEPVVNRLREFGALRGHRRLQDH